MKNEHYFSLSDNPMSHLMEIVLDKNPEIPISILNYGTYANSARTDQKAVPS